MLYINEHGRYNDVGEWIPPYWEDEKMNELMEEKWDREIDDYFDRKYGFND